MPLPEDPELLKLSDQIIDTMRDLFQTPNNYRPVHAKGQLCKGTFTPSKDASKYSKAPIFSQASTTPLVLRYSTDTGFQNFPDNGENGSRGFAIRFVLSEDGHKHYDIITNNAFGFIVPDGQGFLDQFVAQKNGTFDKFLAERPHAKYFVENQSPAHSYSFATEQWHSIHAFKFVDARGMERFFRWRLVPWQGVMKHSQADVAKQSRNYQFEDLDWRMKNHKPIRYRLLAQLAESGDITNDSTKVWPETNEFVEMGEIAVESLWEMEEGNPKGEAQKKIIYDPVPRYIDGIEAGDDPLIELRTAVYLISGRIRREHLGEEVQQAVR
ncbi:heme-dependent catalase [Lecanosticta acicola]|uniref:Heme-dependent catalase n=1 Tax=Lecanosticta acicola TaxID=111012 RepID=A0AAI8YU25_9PEZI|nr:heme-dependent catalase [Lecanosticta acicola]